MLAMSTKSENQQDDFAPQTEPGDEAQESALGMHQIAAIAAGLDRDGYLAEMGKARERAEQEAVRKRRQRASARQAREAERLLGALEIAEAIRESSRPDAPVYRPGLLLDTTMAAGLGIALRFDPLAELGLIEHRVMPRLADMVHRLPQGERLAVARTALRIAGRPRRPMPGDSPPPAANEKAKACHVVVVPPDRERRLMLRELTKVWQARLASAKEVPQGARQGWDIDLGPLYPTLATECPPLARLMPRIADHLCNIGHKKARGLGGSSLRACP